jgi:hypothetical protein
MFYESQTQGLMVVKKCKLYILCTLTLGEITLGQFGHFHDMCIKYTPSKCVAFSLGFIFGVWALYFDFHKVNNI